MCWNKFRGSHKRLLEKWKVFQEKRSLTFEMPLMLRTSWSNMQLLMTPLQHLVNLTFPFICHYAESHGPASSKHIATKFHNCSLGTCAPSNWLVILPVFKPISCHLAEWGLLDRKSFCCHPAGLPMQFFKLVSEQRGSRLCSGLKLLHMWAMQCLEYHGSTYFW